jgi:Holliday junction resolvase-like predicted endonuclease
MLTKKGWQVIERNWRAGRYAEIDIIAYDPEGILVFIEVKTRMAATATSGFNNLGYDKLDRRKIQKLLGCVRLYMAKMKGSYRSQEEGCRIDAFIVNYPIISHSDQIDLSKMIASLHPKVDYIMGFIQ